MSTSNFYKEIAKKNNFNPSHRELIKHISLDIIIFATIYICLQQSSIGAYIFAQILWPVLFFRSFALMHDAAHSSAARKIKLNNILGYIYGAFCFLPYYPWKKAHLIHHNWAGNVEKDPVMKMVRNYNPDKKVKNGIINAAWRSWLPSLAIVQHTVFWGIGFKFLGEAKKKNQFMSWALSYLVPVAIYFGLYKMNLFTFSQVWPGLVIYMIMVEVINFPHHLELPQFKGEKSLPVWEQYQISRSCFYPKWLARNILNNFNYHTEHHMFPRAPWYKLDMLHEEVRENLGKTYNSSHRSAWILRNRKKDIEDVLIYKEPQVEGVTLSHDVA